MAKRKAKTLRTAIGQLTLVEHALCPLDSRSSLMPNQTFETGYYYSDKSRRRRRANIKLFAPLGLSPQDEFYLWGMLALTLADPEAQGQLCATRHYILTQLGVLTGRRSGGRQYDDLNKTLQRLSCIQYQNDAFYDPIRAEHRKVSFGFFSYSMPKNEQSSRAWRIAWDPIFFEWVKPAGGMMRFNLKLYRELDVASRRLFLFVSKIFSSRRSTTPVLELRHLGTDILGYSESLKNGDLKIRVMKAIRRLQDIGVIESDSNIRFTQNQSGKYLITLRRDVSFQTKRAKDLAIDSPFIESLLELKLSERLAVSLSRKYPARLLAEWIDITLAAKERFGEAFFRKCPAAFLQDNLKHAVRGTRTPPDWWQEIRKTEETGVRKRTQAGESNGVDERTQNSNLPQKAFATFEEVQETMFNQFLSSGQTKPAANRNASRFVAEMKKR